MNSHRNVKNRSPECFIEIYRNSCLPKNFSSLQIPYSAWLTQQVEWNDVGTRETARHKISYDTWKFIDFIDRQTYVDFFDRIASQELTSLGELSRSTVMLVERNCRQSTRAINFRYSKIKFKGRISSWSGLRRSQVDVVLSPRDAGDDNNTWSHIEFPWGFDVMAYTTRLAGLLAKYTQGEPHGKIDFRSSFFKNSNNWSRVRGVAANSLDSQKVNKKIDYFGNFHSAPIDRLFSFSSTFFLLPIRLFRTECSPLCTAVLFE